MTVDEAKTMAISYINDSYNAIVNFYQKTFSGVEGVERLYEKESQIKHDAINDLIQADNLSEIKLCIDTWVMFLTDFGTIACTAAIEKPF